jgi:hypothetical protein
MRGDQGSKITVVIAISIAISFKRLEKRKKCGRERQSQECVMMGDEGNQREDD